MNSIDLLPHSGPVAVLEKSNILSETEAYGYFMVSLESELLQGHFPTHSMVPGTYLIEAMAQTADLLLLSRPEFEGKLPLLMSVNNMRLLAPVDKNGSVEIHVFCTQLLDNGMADFKCEAWFLPEEEPSDDTPKSKVAQGSITIACK